MMNRSNTIPTNYLDFVTDKEGKQYLSNLKENTPNSHTVMVRMPMSFVDAIDEVAHTYRMTRSNYVRLACKRSLDYFKKVEEPFLVES